MFLPNNMNVEGEHLSLNYGSLPLESLYVRLDKLGEGTFGTVYKGQDLQTKEFVALKRRISRRRNSFALKRRISRRRNSFATRGRLVEDLLLVYEDSCILYTSVK